MEGRRQRSTGAQTVAPGTQPAGKHARSRAPPQTFEQLMQRCAELGVMDEFDPPVEELLEKIANAR